MTRQTHGDQQGIIAPGVGRRALLLGSAGVVTIGFGPARAAPGPLVRFGVQARRATARAGVCIGHAFAKGDVPAGARLAWTAARGGPIELQQDSENHWPDGSLRFARLAFVPPEQHAAGALGTYDLAAVPGQPQRAAALGPAQVGAACDIRLHVAGQSYGADSFAVSVRDILATLPEWDRARGWGRNPVGGYAVTGVGPVCTTLHAWRYLKRDGDGATHRWVRADFWVTLYAASQHGEVVAMLSQPNSYGPHPAGTVGAAGPQPPHFGVAELWNGAARLYAWGGPHDPRTGPIPASAFDCERHVLTKDAGHWTEAAGCGVVLAGPGTPSLVPQGQVLFLSSSYKKAPALCLDRADAGTPSDGGSPPPWKPDTRYAAHAFVRTPDGRFLRALTTGTTGAATPLANTAVIADGDLTWHAFELEFGRPGAGTATVTPVLATYPGTAAMLADADGDPLPIGQRAAVLVAHDEVYLTRKTRLVPPYDLSIKRVNDAPALDGGPYQPNAPLLPSDLNETGDGAGDTRIGYLDQNQAKLLLTPLDPIRERVTKRQALAWADYPIVWKDERTGQPVQANSRSYAGLVPNGDFALGEWNGAKGKPEWQGLGAARSYYQFRYRPLVDGSHLPAPWIVPYLRTGHPAYAHLGLCEAVSTVASQWAEQRNRTLNGVAYAGIQLANGTQQVRGMGWAIRAIGTLDMMMPDADPMRGFVRDTMDDNARFAAAYPATVNPKLQALGAIYDTAGDEGPGTAGARPFFYSILFLCAAMEAWRGDRPGWRPYMDALGKYQVGIAAVDAGFYSGLYSMAMQSAPGVENTYPSWGALFAANYSAVPRPAPPGLGQDRGKVLAPSTIFQGPASFPGDVTGMFPLARAALAMGVTIGVPGAARAYAEQTARITTPPMHGQTWEGRAHNDTYETCYPAWAIVPA